MVPLYMRLWRPITFKLPHSECQHVSRWQPRLSASASSSVVRGVTNINPDPGFDKASHSGMVLSFSSGLDDTMVPGGSIGQPELHGPGGSLTLKYHHDLRYQPRL